VVLAWAWGFHSTDLEILFKNILRSVASPSPIAPFSHLTTRNKEYLHKTETKRNGPEKKINSWLIVTFTGELPRGKKKKEM
jgi:hypothetical protein